MDFTSPEAQVVLRTIGIQLAQAKREHCAIDVGALAAQIGRQHPRIAEADHLRDQIVIQAARAGVAVYFSTPG